MSGPKPFPVPGVVLAVDVGGRHIEATVMAPDGTVVHAESRPTGAECGSDAVVENVLALAAGLARRFNPVGAGFAVPGIVDEVSGICVFAANLGWREVPIRQWVEEELGVPVVLGNDVRAGGIAEARLGAGRGCHSLLFVHIGTGISAAIIADGQLLMGGHGGAGELGHLVTRPDGVCCACGGRGCLETYASTSAIASRYRQASGEPVTAEEVWQRAYAGDPAAAEIWSEAVAALADGLAAAVSLLDPRRIVIGGELALAGRSLFVPLCTALNERLPFQAQPQVVRGALDGRASCLGAGLLALDARNRPAIPNRGRGRALALVRPPAAVPRQRYSLP
ncbi:ROK family protein [Streptacidiphilus sp. PAMC 29251]